MQKVLDRKDDNQEGKSSNELTPNEPEREDDEEHNDDDRKNRLESLARTKLVDDVLEDNNFKNGTEVSAKPESVKNPEIEEGENSGFNTYNALVGGACETVQYHF